MISLYFVFHFKIHQKIIYYLTETDSDSIKFTKWGIQFIRRVWLFVIQLLPLIIINKAGVCAIKIHKRIN